MLIVRYSSLMRKKPSSRILNVFHQYQTEEEQDKSRAKLLSKLWLKASGFYDLKYKDTETNDNYPANLLYDIQDLCVSNIKKSSEMKENELIYAVFLIDFNLQKNNTNQQLPNFKSLSRTNKEFHDHASILETLTYEMLYKTLGDHIDHVKEKIM